MEKITVQQINNSIETTLCLWCGENNAKFKTLQKGYQEPQMFKIFCCESCNTAFSLPRVNSNEVYELIYKNASEVQGYSRYQHYQDRVLIEKNPLNYLINNEPAYWSTTQAIKKILLLNKKARILEVGSGLGYFTYSLKKDGYNIQGLDISQNAVNEASAKFGDFYICDDLHRFAESNLESFDLVIMTEVIEHFNEPKEFVKSINKLLKKNGSFVFTTPNKSFYPNAVSWYTETPPVHCWWFSEKSIEQLASDLSMRLNFIDFSDYYNKHPFISKIVNLDNQGHFIFNTKGELIKKQSPQSTGFEMPRWLKKLRVYNKLRNYLFTTLFSEKYKIGGVQSNIICAILQKN